MNYCKTVKETVGENEDVYKISNKLVLNCSAVKGLDIPQDVADMFTKAVVDDYIARNDYMSDYSFIEFKTNDGTQNEVSYSADFTLNRVNVRDSETGSVKYRGLEIAAIRLSGYNLDDIRYNRPPSEYYEFGNIQKQNTYTEMSFKYKSEMERE